MGTLWTLLVFLLVTIFAVRVHLKSSAAASPREAEKAARCPRCRAEVPPDVLACPSCQAPLRAFEVAAAPVVAGEEDPGGGRLHPLVRADMCVGCGTCVEVCPERDALSLVDHRAVVNLSACMGHAKCRDACPVGAIVMTSGEAVQRVEVPDLSVNFESNVPGLYVVGELGGRGLIKNAVNEGRLAAEHAAAQLRRASGTGPADPDLFDVAIVGTGPAGLSAALEARRSGLKYLVLERGSVADSIRKYPRHKLLLAEPVKMPLYGDLWIADASKEDLLKVWEVIIAQERIEIRTGHEVTSVSRDGDRFLIEASGKPFRARRLVLAMGRRGSPRRLGVPGEDLGKVVYDVAEMEAFAGRRVLVVGGGDSAVESAVGLSRQAGAEVSLSYRGDTFKRVKPRNAEKLQAAMRAGKVRVFMKSRVAEIREDSVVLEMDETRGSLPNDDVIIRIGGEPPHEFLKRTGVRLVKKDLRIEADVEKAAV